MAGDLQPLREPRLVDNRRLDLPQQQKPRTNRIPGADNPDVHRCSEVKLSLELLPGQQRHDTNECTASIDGAVFFDQTDTPATGASAPFPYVEYTCDLTGVGQIR
jgi:hypothetical protein